MPASQQAANGFRKLWQSIEDADRSQPLFVIEGRRAADHRACRNISVSAALRSYDNSVADMTVPCNSNLSGENDLLAHDRRSGETDLRTQ